MKREAEQTQSISRAVSPPAKMKSSVAIFLAVFFTPLLAVAAQQGNGTGGLPKIRPRAEEIAAVELMRVHTNSHGSLFTNALRRIPVHLEGGGISNIVYHRPMFAFVERSGDLENPGVPEWVRKQEWIHAYETRGEITFITVRVKLSTPELRDACRRVAALELKQQLDSLTVKRWPVLSAVVEVRDRKDRAIPLSIHKSENLEQVPDDWELDLAFDPAQFDRLRTAVERGSVEFAFNYSYEGRNVQSARQVKDGTADVVALARKELNSRQAAGETPILQRDVANVVRNVVTRIKSEITADNPDLIPLIQTTGLETKIFDPGTWMTPEQIKEMYKMDDASLNAFLQPTVTAIQEGSVRKDETTEGTEFVGGVSFIGVGANAKYHKDHTEGVTYTRNKETKKGEPHEVKVFKLLNGGHTNRFTEIAEIHILSPGDGGYYQDTPVSPRLAYGRVWANYSARTITCGDCEGHGVLRCTVCKGTGGADCAKCAGTGLVRVKHQEEYLRAVPCQACGGKPNRDNNGAPGHGWIQTGVSRTEANGLQTSWYWLCPACKGAATGTANAIRTNEIVAVCAEVGCRRGRIVCSNELSGFVCKDGLIKCATCMGKGTLWNHEVTDSLSPRSVTMDTKQQQPLGRREELPTKL